MWRFDGCGHRRDVRRDAVAFARAYRSDADGARESTQRRSSPPEPRPQLNDFFAFDFLAACYLAFGCRANRLYLRGSAPCFGLDLLALLRFLLRPGSEESVLVAHGTPPLGSVRVNRVNSSSRSWRRNQRARARPPRSCSSDKAGATSRAR